MRKKLLAITLCVMVAVSCMPTMAFAAVNPTGQHDYASSKAVTVKVNAKATCTKAGSKDVKCGGHNVDVYKENATTTNVYVECDQVKKGVEIPAGHNWVEVEDEDEYVMVKDLAATTKLFSDRTTLMSDVQRADFIADKCQIKVTYQCVTDDEHEGCNAYVVDGRVEHAKNYGAKDCKNGVAWTCGVCGQTGSDASHKAMHDLDYDTVLTEAATCTTEGYRYYKCKNCDFRYHLKEDAIPVIGHNPQIVFEKGCTCKFAVKCATCGKYYAKADGKVDKKFLEDAAKNEKAARDRYQTAEYLYDWDKLPKDAGPKDKPTENPINQESNPLTHNQTTTTVKKTLEGEAPAAGQILNACTGYTVYEVTTKCSVCQKPDTEKNELKDTIPAETHAWNIAKGEPGKAASCTAEGEKAHFYCERCEKWYKTAGERSMDVYTDAEVAAGWVIPKEAHKFTVRTYNDTVGSCTKPATQEYKCEDCTARYTKELEVNPFKHTWGTAYAEVRPATCYLPAIHAITCTECGEFNVDTAKFVGEKAGHKLVAIGEIEAVDFSGTLATRGEKIELGGFILNKCSVCGEYVITDKNGLVEWDASDLGGTRYRKANLSVEKVVVAPTYFKKGSSQYKIYEVIIDEAGMSAKIEVGTLKAEVFPVLEVEKVAGFAVKAGKKKAAVAWDAYEVQVDGATVSYKLGYKKAGGSWKFIYTSNVSRTIKKLSKGKKYMFAVKAIVKEDNMTTEGEWTFSKYVKIK